jgi:hypothetical protein
MVICLGQPPAVESARQGELFASLAASNVPAVALGRSGREAVACLIDLVRKLREASPDVVLVCGYNAELLGRVAAVLARVPRVIVWVHSCGDLRPRGVSRRICDFALDPVTDAYFGVGRALWARAFLDRSVTAPGERPSLVSQETAVVGGRT